MSTGGKFKGIKGTPRLLPSNSEASLVVGGQGFRRMTTVEGAHGCGLFRLDHQVVDFLRNWRETEILFTMGLEAWRNKASREKVAEEFAENLRPVVL